MELILSVFAGLVMIEVYAWLPTFSKWLTDEAVHRLPLEKQEQYKEEWDAFLDAHPNSAVRLLHALSFFLQIGRVNNSLLEVECEEIDELVRELATEHQRDLSLLEELKLLVAGQKNQHREMKIGIEELRLAMEKFEGQIKKETKPQVRAWFTRVADATDAAIVGLDDATSKEAVRVVSKVSQTGVAIENFSNTAKVLRRRRYLFGKYDPAVRKLKDDLVALSNEMNGDHKEHNEEFRINHAKHLARLKSVTEELWRVHDALDRKLGSKRPAE